MKITHIVLIFLIVFVVSCSPSNSSNRNSSALEKEKLVIWFHSYGSEDVEPAVERYIEIYENAHHDIELEWVFIPGDYNQKMLTSLSAHQPNPDIFEKTSGLDLSITNVRDGQLEMIDDLYPENPEEQFAEKRLQEQKIDGHYYGVPTYGDGGVWYYRKSILEQAGFNGPPQTWMEMIEIAEAVSTPTMKGNFPHANGGVIFASSLMYSSGVADNELSTDGTDFMFDNNPKRAIQALEGLRRLAQSDSTLLSAPQPWWDPSAFINGFTAMQWGGLWMFESIKEALGDDFGVFGIPQFDNEPQSRDSNHFGGWGLSINGFSNNKEQAREFIKWMWIDDTGNDIQLDWNTNAIGQKIPPRYTVREQAFASIPIYQDERLHKIINHNLEWFEKGNDKDYLWDTVMGGAWSEMANDVCNTDKDIETLFLKTSALIQDRLDEINASLGN